MTRFEHICLGTVSAAGMTSSELENKVQKLYVDEKIYKFITVNIFVPLRGYFVRGEVRQPGRFQFISGLTLIRVFDARTTGLAGIKGAKVVVAVNSDARAPITRNADYVIVGDLYKVVPELVEALGAGS